MSRYVRVSSEYKEYKEIHMGGAGASNESRISIDRRSSE